MGQGKSLEFSEDEPFMVFSLEPFPPGREIGAVNGWLKLPV
jgi:hypothetical protein